MVKQLPVSTLRQNLADVLDAVEKKENMLIITDRGKDVSALVNLDLLEDLLALSSPNYLKSIKKAREDIKKGRVKSMDEVFGKL